MRRRAADVTSLLTICKAFFIEALDVFYEEDTFTLDAQELDVRDEQHPHAPLMRHMVLSNMETVNIHDQSQLSRQLSPVTFLAAHYTRLRSVEVPYKLGARFNSDTHPPQFCAQCVRSRFFNELLAVAAAINSISISGTSRSPHYVKLSSPPN